MTLMTLTLMTLTLNDLNDLDSGMGECLFVHAGIFPVSEISPQQ